MKYLPIVALLLLATVAHAQQPELNLKVSIPEAELILKGLRKLPVEDVETLIGKVRQQATEQLTPKPDANGNNAPKKD